MFVLSVKTNRRQLLSVAVCVLLALFTAVATVIMPSAKGEKPASAKVSRAETVEERLSFLKSLGYEVSAEGEEVREIRLPDEADDTLKSYEEIQKTANMSLEPYYGKRVRLYTYSVLNAEEAAKAHIYVYRGRVIAGDIMSERAGGFCKGLVAK
ncbi:MAG: DUF4830 domain-containing protein [Clostridia bacterium]|nr:DUF4830 domain-containing protein [Clostridia bacterium]